MSRVLQSATEVPLSSAGRKRARGPRGSNTALTGAAADAVRAGRRTRCDRGAALVPWRADRRHVERAGLHAGLHQGVTGVARRDAGLRRADLGPDQRRRCTERGPLASPGGAAAATHRGAAAVVPSFTGEGVARGGSPDSGPRSERLFCAFTAAVGRRTRLAAAQPSPVTPSVPLRAS